MTSKVTKGLNTRVPNIKCEHIVSPIDLYYKRIVTTTKRRKGRETEKDLSLRSNIRGQFTLRALGLDRCWVGKN
jgi:hypothetical protein